MSQPVPQKQSRESLNRCADEAAQLRRELMLRNGSLRLLAESEARHKAELLDVAGDRDTYRDLLREALEQLHRTTTQLRDLKARHYRMIDEHRAQRLKAEVRTSSNLPDRVTGKDGRSRTAHKHRRAA